MSFKRLIALSLALCLLLPGLSGCSFGNTVKVASRTDVIAYFNDSGLTSYFEKASGTKIKWLDYGTENVAERVASDAGKLADELPDAYLGLGLQRSEIQNLAAEWFLPLDDQLGSAPRLKAILSDYGDRDSDFRINGKIYSYPTMLEDYSGSLPQKAWINSKWLEKIDRSVPTTTDQLLEVLNLFKEMDPNGNNQADEIPLGVTYQGTGYNTLGFIITAFAQTEFDLSPNREFLNVRDGKVYTDVTSDGYKDALKYLNKLYSANLISADFLNQNSSVLFEGTIDSEIYGVIAAPDINGIFNDAERSKNYAPLGILKSGRDIAPYTLSAPSVIQSSGFIVAKNSKNVGNALKLGDALVSRDGTLTLLYGKEGKGWNKADSRVAAMGGTKTEWKALDGAVPMVPSLETILPYWFDASTALAQQSFEEESVTDLRTPKSWQGFVNKTTKEKYLEAGKNSIASKIPSTAILTPDLEYQLSREGVSRQAISELVLSYSIDFVTGAKDIDAAWATYKSELDSKGLDKLIAQYQKVVDNT
jgi:ABC-type sugar transport system, periplasmic component